MGTRSTDDILAENEQLRLQNQKLQEDLNDAREELAYVLSDWNEIVKAIGARHHSTAIARAKQLLAKANAADLAAGTDSQQDQTS